MINYNDSAAALSTKGSVAITYYTDPLCCWSWALEPQWRKLRYEYEGKITWKYCMAGLVPEWNSYHDPVNSICRPLHMGPLWMEAEQISGMPMNSRIWVDNPPASSYPACLALKCVELQSAEAGEAYLRMLRESVMVDGKNIADMRILFALARKLALDNPSFCYKSFETDWSSNKATLALKEDIVNVKYNNVVKFPSMVFEGADKRRLIVSGYQPYERFVEALKRVSPSIEPTNIVSDKEIYRQFWPSLVEREIQEV